MTKRNKLIKMLLLATCIIAFAFGMGACGDSAKEEFKFSSTPPKTAAMGEELDFGNYVTDITNVKLYVSYKDVESGEQISKQEQSSLKYTISQYTEYVFNLVKTFEKTELELECKITVTLAVPSFTKPNQVTVEKGSKYTINQIIDASKSVLTPSDYENELSLVSLKRTVKAYSINEIDPVLTEENLDVTGVTEISFDKMGEYVLVVKATNESGAGEVEIKVINYNVDLADVKVDFDYIFKTSAVSWQAIKGAEKYAVKVADADTVIIEGTTHVISQDLSGEISVSVTPIYGEIVYVGSENTKTLSVGNIYNLSGEVELNAMDINNPELANGVIEATNVEHVEFDISGNTFFMVEFTGKNAPNFAVGAKAARDSIVVSETSNDYWINSGVLLTNSYVNNRRDGLNVFRGFYAKSTLAADFVGVIAGEKDKGPGMAFFDDDTHYIMIVGYENVTTGKSPYNAKISVKILAVGENNELTVVTEKDATMNNVTHVSVGNKAVIYGNVIAPLDSASSPDSVHFGYEAPAASLNKLINGLSDDNIYKATLKTVLNVGDPESEDVFKSGFSNTKTLVGMDIFDASTNKVKKATGLEYVEFDGHSDATFFIVDFVGKNAPNFAVGAEGARNAITLEDNGEWTKSGCFIWNSSPLSKCYSGLYVTRGLRDNTNSGTNIANIDGTVGKGPGLINFDDKTHYVMIVGYEPVEGTGARAATVSVKIFTVGENNVLTKVFESSANAPTVTHIAAGNKAVIYGNVIHSEVNCDSVTFGYEEPASSLAALINNLPNECVYKTQLKNLCEITG